MARMLKWLGMATLSFALTGSVGCVPQEKYNAKVLENSALSEQLNDAAQQEAATAKAQADAYKSQLDTLQDQPDDRRGDAHESGSAQNKDLSHQVAELGRQVQGQPEQSAEDRADHSIRRRATRCRRR
jgi:hypothetical protein